MITYTHRHSQLALAGSLMLVLTLLTGTARAATITADLTVQFEVNTTCAIAAATLDFGNSAANSPISGDVNATANVSVDCTSGLAYEITMNDGTNASGTDRRMSDGAATPSYITYELYRSAADRAAGTPQWRATSGTDTLTGVGAGAAVNVSVFGQIPQLAAGATPPAGNYADTVVMTLTY